MHASLSGGLHAKFGGNLRPPSWIIRRRIWPCQEDLLSPGQISEINSAFQFSTKEIGKGAKLEVVHRLRGRVTPSFQDEGFLGSQPWPDVLRRSSPMVREGAEKERAMRTILLLRARHSFKRNDSPLGKRRRDQRVETESLQAPI
jgi:hypothetical protein